MTPVTIFEALNWAAEKLKEAEIPNPKFDSQLLLAECLDKPTAYLFAHGEDPLRPDTSDRFIRLVERRARHEPAAYLLGKKDFYGRTFSVTPATLIPRPETELLVELVKAEVGNNCIVVDVGTGSGAIGISLAAETEVEVIAIDNSAEALRAARENAKQNKVADKVAFLSGNLLLPFFETYSAWSERARPECLLIAANLPYLNTRQWEALPPDIKAYEPKTALHGGSDGLSLYDELLMQLSNWRARLPDTIKIFFEIDPVQSSAAVALIKHYFPKSKPEVVKDMGGNWRCVVASV